jgi:hypothetical protein
VRLKPRVVSTVEELKAEFGSLVEITVVQILSQNGVFALQWRVRWRNEVRFPGLRVTCKADAAAVRTGGVVTGKIVMRNTGSTDIESSGSARCWVALSAWNTDTGRRIQVVLSSSQGSLVGHQVAELAGRVLEHEPLLTRDVMSGHCSCLSWFRSWLRAAGGLVGVGAGGGIDGGVGVNFLHEGCKGRNVDRSPYLQASLSADLVLEIVFLGGVRDLNGPPDRFWSFHEHADIADGGSFPGLSGITVSGPCRSSR